MTIAVVGGFATSNKAHVDAPFTYSLCVSASNNKKEEENKRMMININSDWLCLFSKVVT